MKSFPKFERPISVFLLLNLVLYILFITLDLRGLAGINTGVLFQNAALNISLSSLLKYAGIVSCLLIALYVRKNPWRGRDANLQAAVLAITLVPDFLLLFTGFFAAGMIAFFAAHLTALYRYRPRWFPIGLVIALCAAAYYVFPGLASAAAVSPFSSFSGVPTLAVLVLGYALLIIMVTTAAFHAPQPRSNRLLSRLGMCLFIGCDIHVAIVNIMPNFGAYYAIAGVLIWIFYLPAQTLLALSAKRFS
ncbi:MAG: lysoplasmalogenase [Clostridiales bacterium]|nr:lysoplasmalogenase [Clostridiales bacterium]